MKTAVATVLATFVALCVAEHSTDMPYSTEPSWWDDYHGGDGDSRRRNNALFPFYVLVNFLLDEGDFDDDPCSMMYTPSDCSTGTVNDDGDNVECAWFASYEESLYCYNCTDETAQFCDADYDENGMCVELDGEQCGVCMSVERGSNPFQEVEYTCEELKAEYRYEGVAVYCSDDEVPEYASYYCLNSGTDLDSKVNCTDQCESYRQDCDDSENCESLVAYIESMGEYYTDMCMMAQNAAWNDTDSYYYWDECFECPGEVNYNYNGNYTCDVDVMEMAAEACRSNQTETDYTEGCGILKGYQICVEGNCGESYCDRECAEAQYNCEYDRDCYAEMEDGPGGEAGMMIALSGDNLLDGFVAEYCEEEGRADGNCTQLFWNMYECYKDCTPTTCIAEACSEEINACYETEECLNAANSTMQDLMGLPDYAYGEEDEVTRRRLSHDDADGYYDDEVDEDEQRRFANSLLQQLDITMLLDYPAIYLRWFYTYNCEDGGYCNDQFASLLDCAVEGCEEDLAQVNDCLGNQCYDEVISCFDTEQCGYEYTDAVLYYTVCQGGNDTAEEGSVCATNLTEYGEYTTYVQYNCWREGGCSDEYKEVFTCMENCAVSYLDVEDTYCLDCDDALMTCFWDQTCWIAFTETVEILTANGSYAAEMWLIDNIYDADPDDVSSEFYTEMINDLVCENEDYDVECNDEYYAIIDCVYDRCVLPTVPCQVSGCATELLTCANSDQCIQEFNGWANATANDLLDTNRRRMQSFGDLIDIDITLVIPTFTTDEQRQEWLDQVYADYCDGECSAAFVSLMECVTEDCSEYNPDDDDAGDDDSDGSDGDDDDDADDDSDSSDAVALSAMVASVFVGAVMLR